MRLNDSPFILSTHNTRMSFSYSGDHAGSANFAIRAKMPTIISQTFLRHVSDRRILVESVATFLIMLMFVGCRSNTCGCSSSSNIFSLVVMRILWFGRLLRMLVFLVTMKETKQMMMLLLLFSMLVCFLNIFLMMFLFPLDFFLVSLFLLLHLLLVDLLFVSDLLLMTLLLLQPLLFSLLGFVFRVLMLSTSTNGTSSSNNSSVTALMVMMLILRTLNRVITLMAYSRFFIFVTRRIVRPIVAMMLLGFISTNACCSGTTS